MFVFRMFIKLCFLLWFDWCCGLLLVLHIMNMLWLHNFLLLQRCIYQIYSCCLNLIFNYYSFWLLKNKCFKMILLMFCMQVLSFSLWLMYFIKYMSFVLWLFVLIGFVSFMLLFRSLRMNLWIGLRSFLCLLLGLEFRCNFLVLVLLFFPLVVFIFCLILCKGIFLNSLCYLHMFV